MIMKRILLFVVTSLCLFFVGCDNDDKDDVISLTPQELIQTTWDVESIDIPRTEKLNTRNMVS